MASSVQPVLWQLAMGQNDPFSSFAEGDQQFQKQQTVLQQLADGRFRDSRDFQFRTEESKRNQGNTDRSFQFQETEAQRAQRNADRSFGANRADAADNRIHRDRVFGLQQETANTDQIVNVPQGDGTSIPVRVKRHGPEGPINTGVVPTAPPNPYAPRGKLTDEQAKAGLYATRMAAANDIIGPLEKINQGMGGWLEGTVTNAAPIATNSMQSADRQRFIQAQRDFINAVLRRESGAVIAEPEFQNARQQYFPQPGDTPEQLQQKAANRRIAIEGIMSAAGPQYQPPQNYRQPNAPRGPQQTQQQQIQMPRVGEIRDGYRFKGGNAADRNSWEPLR